MPSNIFNMDLIPYQPIGWDAPLVISTVAATHTNAQIITTADTLYIDLAILNNGPDPVLFQNFKYTLSLDGVTAISWTHYPPFYSGPSIIVQDAQSAPLSAGTHQITLTVDSENTVQETNENNNVFHNIFTVLGTTPPPTLSINDISLNEGSSGVSIGTFTVTLSTVATSNVTVNYATANGTGSSAAVAPDDYTSSSGSLTFTAGQTSKTISVTIIGDTVVEPNESFFVNLSGATNAIIADNQGVGTILDDDNTPPVIFDPLQYGASYSDLITGIGANPEALRSHYFNNGRSEGRSPDNFAEFRYIASNSDLINAFGLDGNSATLHYINNGYQEGRSLTAFNPVQYLNSYTDLYNVFETDTVAASQHYITDGAKEGRNPNLFPVDRYIASYGDLIQGINYNLDVGANHYLYSGRGEGRQVTFNPEAYLNRYADLQAAFGNDLNAATRHYIEFGFSENRTWA